MHSKYLIAFDVLWTMWPSDDPCEGLSEEYHRGENILINGLDT